jgi:glutamate--cysteine ligase
MSLDAAQTRSPPITSTDELTRYFQDAQKPAGELLIGLEHEKLLFQAGTARPVPYEGERGIGALLDGFVRRGWAPFREAPGLPVIAATRGQATVSLEPGGQLELSGAPHRTAREAHQENLAHLADLNAIAGELGLYVAALGYRPEGALVEMPWMPKTRYRLMRKTLLARGHLAHHMMLMTATGQVSLDWRNEKDCARKVTAAARVAPVVVALFANSPIADGKETGLASFRSRVWNDVDRARCGYFPAMLDGTFSYRAYVEWALDAPMLFLRRNGQYLDPERTFRRFVAEGYDGTPATWSDWVDHLSTLFPEVRIKKVVEIRSADCVNAPLTGALAAFLRGLLYDEVALDEVLELMPVPGFEAHLALHGLAQEQGLEAPHRGQTLAHTARALLTIARRGLERLDPLDVSLLAPLEALAQRGTSLSADVLLAFRNEKRPGDWPRRFSP